MKGIKNIIVTVCLIVVLGLIAVCSGCYGHGEITAGYGENGCKGATKTHSNRDWKLVGDNNGIPSVRGKNLTIGSGLPRARD